MLFKKYSPTQELICRMMYGTNNASKLILNQKVATAFNQAISSIREELATIEKMILVVDCKTFSELYDVQWSP